MNNHMISPANRAMPAGAIDVWSQNNPQTQLGFAQPAGPQAPSPAEKVQRLLRGRVAIAIVLAVVGAVLGGVLGAVSQAPTYRTVGIIQINPTIPLVEGDKNMPYYTQFMHTQALLLASPEVLDSMASVDPWKSSAFAGDRESLVAVGSGLKPKYEKNTFNITLQYEDENKERAALVIPSVLQAYRQQYKNQSSSTAKIRVDAIRDRVRELEATIKAAQTGLDDMVSRYGSVDLQPLVSAKQATVEEVGRELRGHENNLKAAQDAQVAMKNGKNEMPLEELAQVDAALAQMLSEINSATMRANVAAQSLGQNHPKVRQMRLEIDAQRQYAEEYAETLRRDIVAIIPDFTKPGGFLRVTPGMLRVLEARVARLKSDQATYEKQRDELRAAAGKIAAFNTTIRDANVDLTKAQELLGRNEQMLAMSGDLQVMQNGAFPQETANKKVMFGLLGAIVGSSALVGCLLLMGLMDTRFRYSDDAAGNAMSGIPLLGILPNLPDRLSDPAQASIAAHCVHQIRTMLQLNAMQEHSTCFSVTSASSGDGKTSLSLALGLSFAASGSRTLLIDADLVGGGLTSRLGTGSTLGIVDALAGVDIDQCSQATDVADLAILPIGSAQAHHAGGFSPPAVRKLLGEARKRYEVIIIDTGPVMGSIEATPICASVDAVILTVARGQSRPLVERAITHLQSIGARVAGVVFNRAQHKDFEQSIGAISIRSAARSTVNGTSHNARQPGDIGAVAQAVASSVGGRNDN